MSSDVNMQMFRMKASSFEGNSGSFSGAGGGEDDHVFASLLNAKNV